MYKNQTFIITAKERQIEMYQLGAELSLQRPASKHLLWI